MWLMWLAEFLCAWGFVLRNDWVGWGLWFVEFVARMDGWGMGLVCWILEGGWIVGAWSWGWAVPLI